LYHFGLQYGKGDEVVKILESILQKENQYDGNISTDVELANAMCVIANSFIVETESVIVCDPAAGTGNLLTSAIDVFHLTPTQIRGNEILGQLVDLLSFRVGLRFVKTISSNNSPKFSNKDILEERAIFLPNQRDNQSGFVDERRSDEF
ncbi:MAG: hypothetical protein EZS28_050629, partial [Streblomastix strix]